MQLLFEKYESKHRVVGVNQNWRMAIDSTSQLPEGWEIVTARSLAEIEKIRPIWKQIQRNEPFPAPNADIDRYIAGIRAIGDDAQPYVILMKCNSRPVAMTIGRIEKRQLNLKLGYKTLFSSTLRCISVVYGGIIGQPSSDVCAVLIGELMNALRRCEADLVFLNHLRMDSPIYKLCKTVPHFVSRNHFASPESHWQTFVPDTVEEFYSKIPKSRKRRWRRNIGQLEKASSSEFKIVCYRDPIDVEYLMDVACQIEAATYKNGLGIGFRNSALNRALLEQAAKDGWLKAYILYVGDEPCAFQFDIQYRGTQFSEYGSYDPKWSRGSPGTVLLIKVLEQLCQEPDICIMDYGFGGALYKEKFGTNHWLEESVYIFAPRLRPTLVNMAMSANQAFFLLLSRATTYLNLNSWIKRNWRRMFCKGRGKV